jgi:uncharacterized protein YjbI with pentapeptide repeats
MANPEHLAILKQGSKQWNKWRRKHPYVNMFELGIVQWREHPDAFPDLAEADLRQALEQGKWTEHPYLDIFELGMERWRKWRNEHPNALPDLSGADLSGQDLMEANLGDSDIRDAKLNAAFLCRANLIRADLRDTDLGGANLSGATLRNANLSGVRFKRTDLSGADLNAATLTHANFIAAKLDDADFAGTLVAETNFGEVDLSVAKGLEDVKHGAPSTIGIDTIYRSRGKIPEAFLRGCGVPDDLIGYIKSIAGAIQFFSCFISYSSKDQEFADRLYADLQNKGVRCWFAPHDVQGGRKLHEQLDEAIRLHDKLLLILSQHSMNSNWVKTEIANARDREDRDKKQMLFPITLAAMEDVKQWKLFDADRGIDSAREIREYFIPDFSNWKDHDSYQQAFQRLVKDLKAE